VADFRVCEKPDSLLRNHLHLFTPELKQYPILDLACGDGHNGMFLASKGFSVILADRSEEALQQAKRSADSLGITVEIRRIDLEQEGANPLENQTFSAVLVFRYLHRPLIPCMQKSLKKGGILVYETFTVEQAEFGKPRNPDHLLKPGELLSWFRDWEVLYTFEGIVGKPPKAIAQIICRKP